MLLQHCRQPEQRPAEGSRCPAWSWPAARPQMELAPQGLNKRLAWDNPSVIPGFYVILPQILQGFSSWRQGERCEKPGAWLCKLMLVWSSEMLREDTHLSAAGGPRTTKLSYSSHRAADWDQLTSAAASTKLVLNTAQCRLRDLQVPKLPTDYCTKCFSTSGHTTVVLTELMRGPNAADEE